MIDLRLLQKLFALIFNFDDLKNDIIAKVTSVFLNMFAGNDFSFPLMCKSRSTQDDSVVFVIILVFSFDIFFFGRTGKHVENEKIAQTFVEIFTVRSLLFPFALGPCDWVVCKSLSWLNFPH